MDATGVLISCNVAGNNTPRRCSGIRFGRDWVLTTGSILSSVLQTSGGQNNVSSWKSLRYQENHVLSHDRPLVRTQITFSVITSHGNNTFPNKYLGSKLDTSIPANANENVISSHKGSAHGSSSAIATQQPLSSDISVKHEEYKAVLKYTWQSPLVSEAVETILSSWVLGNSSGENDNNLETESDITKNFLSLFVILKLQIYSEANESDCFLEILREMFVLKDDILRRGLGVVVESTPFGNCFFYNSISEGVISNVVGPGACLLLTDASTALGCEGGPIFVAARRDDQLKHHLVGMVVCSLSWWRGEWVGFSLGVALQPVIRQLLMSHAPLTGSLSRIPPDTSPDHFAGVDDCVVLVRCGMNWGSGVVVDSRDGIILTCSHVVRNAREGEVQVYWNKRRYTANIVFRSGDGLAYDVAVLRAGQGIAFHSVRFSRTAAAKGEPVIAAGFSLFSEDDNVRPTVTRGVVAYVSDPVAMLQTTCCIQSGASGGAVFRYTGEMVGLISCNTMDTGTGALFPRINMAVPTSVLADPIDKFLGTGDVQFLSGMESKDPVVQRLWKLQTTVSKL